MTAKSQDGLKKKDLKRFKEILFEKKEEILKNARRTLSSDMTLDTDDLADEMDLASSEYLQSFTFRLRGREKTFLKKIDHALAKIDSGTYGICEGTGEPIGFERLRLQPWARHSVAYQEELEREARTRGM